jgi:hypothetical protein
LRPRFVSRGRHHDVSHGVVDAAQMWAEAHDLRADCVFSLILVGGLNSVSGFIGGIMISCLCLQDTHLVRVLLESLSGGSNHLFLQFWEVLAVDL